MTDYELTHFTWDPAKAERNRRLHGVTFEQAEEACRDPFAFDAFDVDHSVDEDRWTIVGLAGSVGLVVRVTTTDADAGMVRIISARHASRAQVEQYITSLGDPS